MARYRVRKEVAVTAHVITDVYKNSDGTFLITINDGNPQFPLKDGQAARMEPQVGDYYVITDDGYEYLNPKAVFEAKYKEVPPNYGKIENPVEEAMQ